MSKPKLPRRIIEPLRALGITVEGWTRNKHFKLHIRNRHGATAYITMHATGSDYRSDKNHEARLRRFADATTSEEFRA